MSSGKEREPAGDVLFAEREGSSGKQDEWIKNGAPCNLILIERVVQMARADRVFREDQRARACIPDGKSPITNELAKTILAPVFVGDRDDLNIRRANRQNVAQPSYQIRAVVQTAIPGEDGAG